jgi:endonuclease YncB( thermonuclease family)
VAFALAAAALLQIPQAAPVHAAANEGPVISGRAIVIDGDTIEIGGSRVRLEGIDAPEASQTCGSASGTWGCGAKATAELQSLVGERRIDCENAGHDKYGRVLGWCSLDGRDINAEMVRSGYAWAFVRYSTRYQDLEAEARKAKSGIWQGEAEPAWTFREHRWSAAEESAPNGCAIKGNVTANGRIYHMPWSPWYNKVRVEPAKGERWFCSEAEASKDGFRPVMTH